MPAAAMDLVKKRTNRWTTAEADVKVMGPIPVYCILTQFPQIRQMPTRAA